MNKQVPAKNIRISLGRIPLESAVIVLAVIFSAAATAFAFSHGYITAYGDAESHLNIAKRVVDSLTPGFAQLGGIWLPLPHLLMIPFVKIDFLWRTGLAGSIVSGAAYVISSWFLYRLVFLLTKNKTASLFGALVFMTNPNILYLQTTPMTELVLIVFFILSSYYFIKFLQNDRDLGSLIAAAAFGFCAALSRYDGWSLVLMEAGILVLLYLPWKKIPASFLQVKSQFDKKRWEQLQGRTILFSTLAFFGIGLWLLWDLLILGDPLYFTHSQFSANSQQQSWLIRGELPAYHHIFTSLSYYVVTSAVNAGIVLTVLAAVGLIYLLTNHRSKHLFFVLLVLLVPFIFNVVTLYLGQSVIFIPQLTPASFEWRLFNVRYGIMMVPFFAFCAAFLFFRSNRAVRGVIALLLLVQLGVFATGRAQVITLEDGIKGLSSGVAKLPNAQFWFAANYDQGLVLVDDYARTMSIIRTKVPMQNVIYVGNKPYWDTSLKEPEKYANWIIMQKNDDVWNNIYDKPDIQGRLFKYFVKVYTSPEILIFKRNPQVAASS
jgi:hypothetical protein